MQIINETNYDTRALRTIFTRALREVCKTDRITIRRVYVRTHANGATWVGGCAGLGSDHLTMKLPHPNHGPLKAWKVADTFIHEVGHCLGHNHRRRRIIRPEGGEAFWSNETIEHHFRAWTLETWPHTTAFVPVAVPVVKARPDVQTVRYERARSNLARAETRLGRAKTLRNKWATKVRYYERALAAKGPSGTGGGQSLSPGNYDRNYTIVVETEPKQ